MELGIGSETEAFRAQVRAFAAEYAPAIPPRAGVRSDENETELKSLKEWTARLFEAGCAGADRPAEYSGRDDRSAERGIVVGEEWARAAVPGVQSGSVRASMR